MNTIKKRFALYLITSYMVVFLFPLLICGYLFNRHTMELQDSIEKSNQAIVDNISQNVNNLLSDLEHELRSLSLQTARLQKLPVSEGVGNPLNFSQLHLQLFLKSRSNLILDSGYIVLFDDRKVITPFVAGNALETFYGPYFQYGDMDSDGFVRYFTDNNFECSLLPHTELVRNGVKGYWTVYAQSVPNDSYRQSKGVILFILNFDYITELMENSLPDDSAIALFSGGKNSAYGENHLISSAANGNTGIEVTKQLAAQPDFADGTAVMDFQGQEYYVSQKGEAHYGIRVVMAQPSKSALSALRSFKLVICLQILATAVITMLIIYYNTRKNVNSVKTIMDTFSSVTLSTDEMKDVYAFIQNAASKTISQNVMLQTYVDKQQGIMAEAFFRRLINGDYLYESDLLQDCEELKLPLRYKTYVIVLCSIRVPKNDGFAMKSSLTGQVKQQLRDKLSSAFEKDLYLLDYDISSLVLIFGGNDDSGDFVDDLSCSAGVGKNFDGNSGTGSLKDSIDEFFTGLSFPVPVAVCGGSFVMALSDIPRSYREARYVNNNTGSTESGCNVRWYTEIYENPVLFSYQDNYITEQNLLNQILVGNTPEVERQLESTCREFIGSNGSSPKTIRCLAYDLYRLASYVLSLQKEARPQAVELNQKLDAAMLDGTQFPDFVDYVKNLCISISLEKQNEKSQRGDTVITQAVDYIREHLDDSQLSVSAIAEHCGLSSKYLSQFFKEQKNENISTFIERIRIEKACEYLKGTTYTINEISEMVGYTTPHTFRTAFKRCMYLTPREYRDMP